MADRSLTTAHAALTDRAHRVARRTHAAVERADERLALRTERLRSRPIRQLDIAATRLVAAQDTVVRHTPRRLVDEQRALDGRAARLSLLDPVNLIRRGWSITRDADGDVVRSVAGMAPGTVITTQVADGRLTSRIEEP